MAEGIRFIDAELIEAMLRRAEESPRRRVNHNFHNGPDDNPHRFLNVFLRGSYVAPHRHLDPPKSETFLVLEGLMAVLCFDDTGAVTGRWAAGSANAIAEAPTGFAYVGIGLDLAPGVWHTVAALTAHAVCFEVKPGPWDPATDKEFASWAPREGDAGASGYLRELLRP